MKSWKHYNSFQKERKVFFIVMVAILACLVALFVLELTGEFRKEEYTHQVEYPIANTNVSWSQTFYPGAWGDEG